MEILATLRSLLFWTVVVRFEKWLLCCVYKYFTISLAYMLILIFTCKISIILWMVVCINLTYLCTGWMTSNPKWKSKNTTNNRLGSRRVEDTKGVNLNTILIKLKCQNTQHKMDCVALPHPSQLCRIMLCWRVTARAFDKFHESFMSCTASSAGESSKQIL